MIHTQNLIKLSTKKFKVSEIENALKKLNTRTKLINWVWTLISETKINSEMQNRKYMKKILMK